MGHFIYKKMVDYSKLRNSQKLFYDFNLYGCCFYDKQTGQWIDATKVRITKEGKYVLLEGESYKEINVIAEFK